MFYDSFFLEVPRSATERRTSNFISDIKIYLDVSRNLVTHLGSLTIPPSRIIRPRLNVKNKAIELI